MFYLTVPYILHSLELWIILNGTLLFACLMCIQPRVFLQLLHEYFETPVRDPVFYQAWVDEWSTEENNEENIDRENT